MTASEVRQEIPFALPDITADDIDSVVAVLRSRWLTTGAVTRQFEAKFAEAVSAHHAIALNSCTAALHLSLEALGVRPGDSVFVPTFTFAATGEVVRYLGAIPVLVDVDPLTCNIDPVALRGAVERVVREGVSRPKAIMPVHYAGAAAEMDDVWDLAREFDLAVIEDAAHAFPSTYGKNRIGWTPEDIPSTVCFSFYATKTITTGEGGMVTTRSSEVADRIRRMSLHGLSKQAWNRYAGGTWRYDIVAPGYKYNLTDIASALGLTQLKRSREMAKRRNEIAAAYNQAFSALPGYVTPQVPVDRVHAWHLYQLRIAESFGEENRDALIEMLRIRHGIGTSVHFIPLHLHSFYRESFGYKPHDFPAALNVFEHCLSLPIYSSMSDGDVQQVIDAVTTSHITLCGAEKGKS
ncbi:DegT/DnrJ/EryC1/StrS family aminotransferase [Flexivirga oryzae]|uniref:Perosamine synthetase n=1 Tax=Flexivirga oryzae TaxID=1794944 RepID=A0A839N256_9MICO|nr:DegT/DnrJ/EryC1/StrS family aminotransferase [Flexivirga oryzae]MBB2890184.1 perosamine synthetase [Flexivirga oryzae]